MCLKTTRQRVCCMHRDSARPYSCDTYAHAPAHAKFPYAFGDICGHVSWSAETEVVPVVRPLDAVCRRLSSPL